MSGPEQEPREDKVRLAPSGRQIGAFTGLFVAVIMLTMILQRVLFPDSCRLSGGAIVIMLGIPISVAGRSIFYGWMRGDRRAILRETGLYVAVLVACVLLMNGVECYFEGAWYAIAVWLPPYTVIFYFAFSRLIRISGAQFPPDDSPADELGEKGIEREGGAR